MREKSIEIVRKKYEKLRRWLNEKSRRIWAASEAEALGFRKGIGEAEEEKESDIVRIRGKGGGRKKLTAKHPEILTAIKNLVDSSTGGNP